MSHHQRRRRAATAHGPVAGIVQLDSMELPAMGGWRARRKRRLAQGGKGGTNWKGASMLARLTRVRPAACPVQQRDASPEAAHTHLIE